MLIYHLKVVINMSEKDPQLWGRSRVDPKIDTFEKVLQNAYANKLIAESHYRRLVGEASMAIAMYDFVIKSFTETERYEREKPFRDTGIVPRGGPQFLAPPLKVSVIDGPELNPDNFIGLYLVKELKLPFIVAAEVRDRLNFMTMADLLNR